MERNTNPALNHNPLLDQEDLEALKRVQKHFSRSLPNVHVQQAGLKPWMRQFAAWYALEGSAYKRHQQLAKASAIAHGRINRRHLLILIQRADFQALVDRYSDDKVEATRDRFKDLLPKITENIEWSIDRARSADDYKAMPSVVDPVLTRTIPKKDETPPTPPQIVINIGGHFAKTYVESEIQDAEVEELPAPKDNE